MWDIMQFSDAICWTKGEKEMILYLEKVLDQVQQLYFCLEVTVQEEWFTHFSIKVFQSDSFCKSIVIVVNRWEKFLAHMLPNVIKVLSQVLSL